MSKGKYRLAIDVGGTFTDVVLVDDSKGAIWFGKVLSTPDDPSRGSLTGASEILLRLGIPWEDIGDVIHASTVATNAVLELKGAPTGLLTTLGFRDVLEMGREARYDIYDLCLEVPPPLVPRCDRREVTERLTAEGVVRTPLDESGVASVIRTLVEEREVKSLAICLLHGYAHPMHEKRVAQIARELYPDVTVSVSHEVSAEIREFERLSTTVIDAYVKPLVKTYVRRLIDGLRAFGMKNEVSMMLSNGGIGPAIEVSDRFPVRMIESGPAAGAMAAGYIARRALEIPNAIAFDMGGTTAKISVVRDGEPTITHEYEVGHVRRFKRGSGYPLQISAIELLEIGAGGGSIAHINELGLLNVGPRSAGAEPGPVCYGQGGKEPTVTDADLVLGYLDPERFLGGDMVLNVDAVCAAIGADIGVRLKMTVEQVAWGIHDVVNESMAAAIRAHAAEAGVDLRRFSMIAFGGAGPIHAYSLARKLGIMQVLCPFGAGVASAIGCLTAPPAVDLVTAYFAPLTDTDWVEVEEHFKDMRSNGEHALANLVGMSNALEMERSVDMRCQGQGYSVTVPLATAKIGENGDHEIRSAFERIYETVYGHIPPDVPLEVVGLRARIAALSADGEFGPPHVKEPRSKNNACIGSRNVYFEASSGYTETAIYDRYALPNDEIISGPAIICERETSIVVGPDATFYADCRGNIVVDILDERHAGS